MTKPKTCKQVVTDVKGLTEQLVKTAYEAGEEAGFERGYQAGLIASAKRQRPARRK